MENQPKVDIREIQNAVENQLMAGQYKQLARAYIEYRHDRDISRELRGRLNQEIQGLVEQSNKALLNENANKDSKVIPTQRDLLAGIVAKHYAKQHLLPRDVVLAHERGEIHYHDLDYAPFFPMFNCMLIDLEGMLTQGFKMGNAEIEPPKSISTATAVTAQIIAQVASHIYGAPPLTVLMKFWPLLSRKALINIRLSPKSGRSLMLQVMPCRVPKKSVTTPSSHWSMRSIHCIPRMAKRPSSPSVLAWAPVGNHA